MHPSHWQALRCAVLDTSFRLLLPGRRDVLLPFFNHVYEKVMSYPWEKKTPKALMRAAMQVCRGSRMAHGMPWPMAHGPWLRWVHVGPPARMHMCTYRLAPI